MSNNNTMLKNILCFLSNTIFSSPLLCIESNNPEFIYINKY